MVLIIANKRKFKMHSHYLYKRLLNHMAKIKPNPNLLTYLLFPDAEMSGILALVAPLSSLSSANMFNMHKYAGVKHKD
jgi:hypothetical protein